MSQSLFQPSFAAGELSPELRRRIDLAKYSIGAEIIQNMVVLPRGGVQSRTGTKLVLDTKRASTKCKLIDFPFSTTQAYILEFGDLFIRYYKDGGVIMKDDNSEEYYTVTTYAEADLPYLKFEQSADTLYIFHPTQPPRTLTRTGHTAWVLAELSFIDGPLRPENTTSTTIRIDATGSPASVAAGATVVLTASSNTFVAGHVGAIFAIRHTQSAQSYYRSVTSGGGVYVSDNFPVWGEWELTIQPSGAGIDNTAILLFKSVDGGSTWYKIHSVPATTSTATVIVTGSTEEPALLQIQRDDVADSFNFTINSYGHAQYASARVTTYSSATAVTATMLTDFDQCGIAFRTWSEGLWSTYRGWPVVGSFFQDRLGYANNADMPNSFGYSKTGDYPDFGMSLPHLDDDAIASKLLGRVVNAIQWMVPLQAHVLLTNDSEWTIEPQIAGAFSSKTIQVKQQSYFGSSGLVEPVVIGDMAVFLQRDGKTARAMGYNDVAGKSTKDLSVIASHLFEDATVVDWAYQQYPHSILWVILSDGSLLSFTMHLEHEVFAWCRHNTEGLFESIAVVPGDGQDDVYFVVNRTINGVAHRFIEMFAHRDVSEAQYFVGSDCSLTYEGSATNTVSGLTHLAGEVVEVLADGVPTGQTTVSAEGTVSLVRSASRVHVGLPFTWLLKTLQVDVTSKQTGYGADKKKLISGVTLSVKDSMGGKAGGENQYSTLNYPPRTGLYSGDIEQRLIASWGKEGQFEITGSGVQPFHCTGMLPQVTVGGL